MSANRLLAALFLAFFLAQGSCLIVSTSPTTDEVPFHMVNGYAYLQTHDYRMSPANPALLRQWMALPWFAFSPKLDLEKQSWKDADSVPFGTETFYRDNRAIADKLLYSSRAMILVLGAALGWLIYVWSSKLYGKSAGLLSLALYSFCPNFLAYSSIAHTDVGVTLFSTASLYFLWKHLRDGKASSLLGMAVCFGLAAASKHNALYVGPILVGVLWWRKGLGGAWGGLWRLAAVGFVVVWASYGFETKPLLWNGVPRIEEKQGYISAISDKLFPANEAVKSRLQKAALQTPIPAPSYILGFAGIVRSHQSAYRHYSFGKWGTEPNWYHYFYSFAAKMTLPFLILLFWRLVLWKKVGGGADEIVLVLPIALLFLITAKDSTGVGLRYLLPGLPMLFVLIGGLAKWAAGSKKKAALIGVFLAWQVTTAFAAIPDNLSYFNEAAGGVRGGAKNVRGSDVDWGQGLKPLKRYLDQRGIDRVTLHYFGTADPSFYGIEHDAVSDAEVKTPQNKVYAVSGFYLEHLDWTADIEPAAVVNGIWVYDLRKVS